VASLNVRAIGALVAAAALAASATVRAQASLQDKLKAAIVSKFPQFVEWPPDALDGRTSVDVCVATPDPFGSDLEELVAGETLDNRKVSVRRVAREQDVDGCQLLVIPSGATARRALLQRAATQPILTIGDDARFLDEGGIVRLRLVEGRMRFDVNAAAARRVGLRISAQLLQLAASVQGAEP